MTKTAVREIKTKIIFSSGKTTQNISALDVNIMKAQFNSEKDGEDSICTTYIVMMNIIE